MNALVKAALTAPTPVVTARVVELLPHTRDDRAWDVRADVEVTFPCETVLRGEVVCHGAGFQLHFEGRYEDELQKQCGFGESKQSAWSMSADTEAKRIRASVLWDEVLEAIELACVEAAPSAKAVAS